MLNLILLDCQHLIRARETWVCGSTHRIYYVEDPVETQYWINGNGSIVKPFVATIGKLVSEQRRLMIVAHRHTPVVEEVPEDTVATVHSCTGYEKSLQAVTWLGDTPQREGYVLRYAGERQKRE